MEIRLPIFKAYIESALGTDKEERIQATDEQLETLQAVCEGVKQQVQEMVDYLDELPCEVTEYDEQLVRRLVEKITVYDEKIIVEFKSGVGIESCM